MTKGETISSIVLLGYLNGKNPEKKKFSSFQLPRFLWLSLKKLPMGITKIMHLLMPISWSRIIGEGGYGRVFHGVYHGTEVAVKWLFNTSSEGKAEFEAEIKVLLGLPHPRLVSLLGFHESDGMRFLVYEFMARGSLEGMLEKKSPQLTAKLRRSIARDLGFFLSS